MPNRMHVARVARLSARACVHKRLRRTCACAYARCVTRGLCIAAAGFFIFKFTAFALAFVAMSIAAADFFIFSFTGATAFAFVAVSFFTGLLARGFVPSLMGSSTGVASSDDVSAAGAGPGVGSGAGSAGAGADPCTTAGILFGSMRGPSWFCSI